MVRRVIKKIGTILLVASLTIGVCSPSVSAAVKIPKIVQAKTARYVQPEEWNNPELKVYQFASEDELASYALSGGSHLYNEKYNVANHWVKITAVDSGIFTINVTSLGKEKITLYDATKKKILAKNVASDEEDDYMTTIKEGDVMYLKLPAKIKKVIVMVGAYKSGFSSMSANGPCYYEAGEGTTTYHPFSVSKRSEVDFSIFRKSNKIGKVSIGVEKYQKGKWERIGDTATIMPLPNEAEPVVYGLQPGKYRLALKNPKGQIISAEYDRYTVKKEVAYKRSKALKIKSSDENIYTQDEQVARWYQVKVSSLKKKSKVELGTACAGGGFQFVIYKKGKKKAVKTIKIKYNQKDRKITLPKEKGTYYIKVSKLTKKTNGVYYIGSYTY